MRQSKSVIGVVWGARTRGFIALSLAWNAGTVALADGFQDALDHYRGFSCQTEEGVGKSNLRRVETLELRRAGHDAKDEDGKPFVPYELVHTPAYIRDKQAPQPRVIMTDLDLFNLGDSNKYLIEANTANAHAVGDYFRSVTTRVTSESTLGVVGSVFTSETLEVTAQNSIIDRNWNGHTAGTPEVIKMPLYSCKLISE